MSDDFPSLNEPAPDEEFAGPEDSGTDGEATFGEKPPAPAESTPQEPPESAPPESGAIKIGDQEFTPEQLQEALQSHSRFTEFHAANNRRAQELAEERKAFEASQGEYDSLKNAAAQVNMAPADFVKSSMQWHNFTMQNPAILKLIDIYASGSDPNLVQYVQQLGFGGQPVRQYQQGPSQESTALEKKIDALAKRLDQNDKVSDMASAFERVKGEFPDIDQEAFRRFEAETLSGMDDHEVLYRLLLNGFVGKNKEAIARKAREEALRNQAASRNAAVEQGGGAAGAELPDNVDVSNMTDDDMIEHFLTRIQGAPTS